MSIYQTIKQEAAAMAEQLKLWRRDFHAHPELGFQEFRTAGIVAEHLNELGLEVSTGIGKTGVVALVEGDDTPEDAPTVLLRFDMDALPIHEETGLPFKSQNEGVMHACGHDGHTAIGMGVAQILTQHRQALQGRIKLVFQPAEEIGQGAQAMISDSVLEGPQPQASFGLHLWSRLPLNQVVIQSGPLWASAGEFHLTVHGAGGHGAVPQETIDATVIASQLVTNWQMIVARNLDPMDRAVITVGSFHSGSAFNIISGEAKLSGTVRTFDPEVQEMIVTRMQQIANGICQAHGATCDFVYHSHVPATINAEAETVLMQEAANEIVDPEQIIQIDPMMVGEDMSEFLNRVPGCFILVGASDPEQEMHQPHHHPAFDFDERMMPTGVALLASAAVRYLEKEG